MPRRAERSLEAEMPLVDPDMPLVDPYIVYQASEKGDPALLPCPCCGGRAVFSGSPRMGGLYVRCVMCGLSSERMLPLMSVGCTEADVLKALAGAWNRRTGSSASMARTLGELSSRLLCQVSRYCNEVGCEIDAGMLEEVSRIERACSACSACWGGEGGHGS